jgi:cysteine desulfurase family protein (TIGR01976 family)
VAPWLIAARDSGAGVRWVDFDPADCSWSPTALARELGPHTRLVAVGYASNAVGTVNDVKTIVAMAHAVGALAYIDAVQYAPHGPIDVRALDCDFLACSAYKFFGPHAGIVWGREELLEQLRAYKVRPAGDRPPDKFETGTQNHEGQAGILAAIEYLEELGQSFGAPFAEHFPGFSGRRLLLKQAVAAIRVYERQMFEHFVAGLLAIPGLSFYGISDPARFDQRTPTAAFNLAGRSPQNVAEQLARLGIYVWAGNFYAQAVTERLGLEKTGGVVRAGLVHYNTREEVDFCLQCLRELK